MDDVTYKGELILLRGLPGSGKTTLASVILSTPGGSVDVLSADDFFVNERGEYHFDGSKLKEAHNSCQVRCAEKMKLETFKIVVANTFTQDWEMIPYYEMAERYGYRVHSVIVENKHNGSNIHGVPEDKIIQMKNRFEVKL
jgi:hypothetical protein